MIFSFWASLPPHRRAFLIIMIFVQLSIIWPGFALMSAAEPLFFGLPLSFAWLIAMLLLGFAALLMLYFGDNRREGAAVSSDDAPSIPSPETTAPDRKQPDSGGRNKHPEGRS